MTREIAAAALQFMQRVQLSGQEVPAWNAVCAALTEIRDAPPLVDAPQARTGDFQSFMDKQQADLDARAAFYGEVANAVHK